MNSRYDARLVGGIFALSVAVVLFAVAGGLNMLVRENGLLECAQLVLMALSLISFANSGVKFEGPVRSAGWTMAAVCLMCFFREIDLRSNTDVPAWLAAATGSPTRDIIVSLMGLGIFIYIFRWRTHLRDWAGMMLRLSSWPIFASGVFLFIGIMLDNKFVTDDAGRLWEELAETISYILLLEASRRHMAIGRESMSRETVS